MEKIKTNFATILLEIYQIAKTQFSSESFLQNNSIEILWYSVPISNQIYKAQIKLFLIIRSIGIDQKELLTRLSYLKNIFITSLMSMKFSLKDGTDEILFLDRLNKCNKIAIVKEDALNILESYIMNQCYVYDKFPSTLGNFNFLIDFLSNTPNSAISIQLIPTYYSYNEKTFIEKACGTLETINRGVHDMMIGNIINPIAERYATKYRYYEKNKNSSLFCFNNLVMSDKQNIMSLSSKMCGHIDGGTKQEDKVPLKILELCQYGLDLKACFSSLPWVLNDMIMNKIYVEYPIDSYVGFDFWCINL